MVETWMVVKAWRGGGVERLHQAITSGPQPSTADNKLCVNTQIKLL